MKKIEITLKDKLKFLANAHFYDAYLDNKSYRWAHLAQIGFYGMAVVTCALSTVLSPSLAIAGIGALCIGIAISHDEYKTRKEIVERCGEGIISYKQYKKMKKSGELEQLKSTYSDVIDSEIKLCALKGNFPFVDSKRVKRKKLKTAKNVENYEEAVSKIFGKPYAHKTQRRIEEEAELEQEISNVFGKSEYQKIRKKQSKHQTDERQF